MLRTLGEFLLSALLYLISAVVVWFLLGIILVSLFGWE
jgi:hypothetical protein